MSRSLKILGIETASDVCELAIAEDEQVLATARLGPGQKPTAHLVPAIRDLCQARGWLVRQLDLISVDIGPGSYTGLRVGLMCAKTLAFAAGAGLATANALEVVASAAPTSASLVEVAFDAARGQVFAARFARSDERWSMVRPVAILAAADWARGLDPAARVTGPALIKYRSLVPSHHRVADESEWRPRAERVIELGLRQYRVAPIESFWTLEPEYMRPSAAEEKRARHA